MSCNTSISLSLRSGLFTFLLFSGSLNGSVLLADLSSFLRRIISPTPIPTAVKKRATMPMYTSIVNCLIRKRYSISLRRRIRMDIAAPYIRIVLFKFNSLSCSSCLPFSIFHALKISRYFQVPVLCINEGSDPGSPGIRHLSLIPFHKLKTFCQQLNIFEKWNL